MADIEISVDAGTSKRLLTAGKYCDKNILVSASGGASPVIEPLEVTTNGTYTAPAGVDGYSPVTVNVSGGDSGASGSLYIAASQIPYVSLIRPNGESTIIYTQDYQKEFTNVMYCVFTYTPSALSIILDGDCVLEAERQVGYQDFLNVYKINGKCVMNIGAGGGGGTN